MDDPAGPIDFEEAVRRSRAACDALSDADDALKREVLSHAGNRWSLGIVYALGSEGTLRHADIARRLPGITQRMLTRSLRQLERDGLVLREDRGEVPPRVDYALTELGQGFLVSMLPVWSFVVDKARLFERARERYRRPRAQWLDPKSARG